MTFRNRMASFLLGGGVSSIFTAAATGYILQSPDIGVGVGLAGIGVAVAGAVNKSGPVQHNSLLAGTLCGFVACAGSVIAVDSWHLNRDVPESRNYVVEGDCSTRYVHTHGGRSYYRPVPGCTIRPF